jgi:putative ABC transport system permease protein
MTDLTMTSPGVGPARRGRLLPLPIRLALRELRSGLGGFYVFIACVALGVAVIAAVGALSDGLRAGFEAQGQRILGGDVTLARIHKRADASERQWLAGQGRLSETATLRAMARTRDGEEQMLVELKGVDGAYPLAGELRLEGGETLSRMIAEPGTAVIEPMVLERLRLKVGDHIQIGEREIRLAAVIASEPDTITDRLTFGPRIMMSLATLETTGLVQPGTLIRWRYGLALDPARGSPVGLKAFRDEVRSGLPESGFVIADRRDPSPNVTRTLDRLRQFLTLIGLTALMIGGVGVANAVATFLDRRRKVIAIMKSLGATGGLIFQVFAAQVMLIAAIGVGIGLGVGYLLPGIVRALVGEALPVAPELRLEPASVLVAALYGFLVAAVFTLWPLGRAELVAPAALYRDDDGTATGWPRPRVMVLAALMALLLAGLAIAGADSRRLALYFVGGLIAVLALFAGLGTLVALLARRLPRPRRPELALAIGAIGSQRALTRSVVVSLGAGLSVLVSVALADSSIRDELATRLPKQSPTFFVLDVARADLARLKSTVLALAPGARIDQAPMLRGRLVSIKGQPVESLKVSPEAQWVLNGDRGLTYSETVPEGSKVVAGTWWPAGHAGEPQVSFEAELAKRLEVGLGDTVTVNVLGRNVTARITSLREVKWESLAINFVMVFSPNTLQAAPHNLLATITLPTGAELATEAAVARALGRDLPAVTAIRVKDAINSFRQVFTKVMTAVEVAGGVTLVAGALVLAGALATARRRRILDAVILRALGATSGRILTAHAIEYAALALVTALLAVAVGSLAAWIVTTQVMEIEFAFSAAAVAQALAVALGLVMLLGGLGTRQALQARPVPYLRSE